MVLITPVRQRLILILIKVRLKKSPCLYFQKLRLMKFLWLPIPLLRPQKKSFICIFSITTIKISFPSVYLLGTKEESFVCIFEVTTNEIIFCLCFLVTTQKKYFVCILEVTTYLINKRHGSQILELTASPA